MTEAVRERRRFLDEGALRTHFGRDQAVVRDQSKAGAQLEKAELLGLLRPHGVHENAELNEDQYVRVSHKYPSAPWPKMRNGKIVRSSLEITAQPMAETHSSPAHEVSDAEHDAMLRHGETSRRLNSVGAQTNGRNCVLALRYYYGERGDQYAAAVLDGKTSEIKSLGVPRIVALYPLTFEGRELLRVLRADRAKHGAPDDIKAMQLLRTTVWQGKKAPRDIQERLARCAREAQELLYEAQDRWMGTGAKRRMAE
jgi:hypothetical protein